MNFFTKLLTRKTWAAIVIVGAVLATGLTYYFMTRSGQKRKAPDPAFSEYISAYTSGFISSESSIRIVLTSPSKDSIVFGQEANGLFDFSPNIEGTANWIDQYTIEFKPEKRLPSGKEYKASFQLDKVANVKEDRFSVFDFNFAVLPQSYDVEYEGLRCVGSDQYELKGRLLLADVVDLEEINSILSLKGDNNGMEIKWSAGVDRRTYLFSITKIKRKETKYDISLSWDGKRIGVDKQFDYSLTIPGLNDFSLLEANVLYSPDQHVSLIFSNPIKLNQELTGLITLERAGDLKFSILNNEIKVYPSARQTGSLTLRIAAGLRDINDRMLPADIEQVIYFEQLKPAVRAVDEGVIIPSGKGILFPFEAVGVKSVVVKIIKVYENNVPQFLQVNDLKGDRELVRVGRPMLVKTVMLSTAGVANLSKWNRYHLDLSEYINPEPGALYQVTISFKKKHAIYDCAMPLDDGNDMASLNEDEEEMARFDEQFNAEDSYWDYYDDYYYEDYDWSERENPCHASYYTVESNTTIRRNVLASDLGIIAKSGTSGDMKVVVTDIRTAEPISGVEIQWLDYQQQVVASEVTNGNGEASSNVGNKKIFLVIAKQGNQRGYLKLDNASSLSVSNFDVSGTVTEKGLKGFIYGERGVWRPGDSLFVSFMLEDRKNSLPSSHPIVFELFNPSGQLMERKVTAKQAHGLHVFASKTEATAPTGSWTLKVKAGGAVFSKNLKIEEVKPNRLKINLDFGKDRLVAGDAVLNGKLNARWLHGATASHLAAKYTVYLSQGKTTFDKFKDFEFDDPGGYFETVEMEVFDGELDEQGNANVRFEVDEALTPPGALNAFFKGKVFEPGGDFSIDNFTIPYYPYTSFAGLMVPPGDKARGMLLTDEDQPVQIVTLDGNGKMVPNVDVTIELYKLDWRWWWEQNDNSMSNWVSSSSTKKITDGKIRTGSDGKGVWKFNVKYPEWGRFYVKVTNTKSGHSAGKVVYIDWPGWAGKGQRVMPGGASMLSVYADKAKYTTGEKVTVKFPGGNGAKAYVSIENGSSILATEWVDADKEMNEYTFEALPNMAPNIYVHTILVQPHQNKNNDQPLRMYGIVPVLIENAASRLVPKIEMADEIRPEQEVTIKVSEQNGKPMAYTLAMVDEGLLDLTRFKTPDPHASFYAREALGVRTWDVFDDVIGSFGAEMERLLSLGGDGIIGKPKNEDNNLRFKPVVKFFGPFLLEGGSATHRFKMPNYIGSVRVMVVAGKDAAYGNAEKTVAVKQPLMVLATLPRVLGPEEEVVLPVNLFVSGSKPIKNAQVSISVSGPIELSGASSQNVTFGANKDKLIRFSLKTKSSIGQAKVMIKATSGDLVSTHEIIIPIRNANPEMVSSSDFTSLKGESMNISIDPLGMIGTNKAILEVSSIPSMNLAGRLQYLLAYPYGCIEQTTSAAFPQLYLSSVMELDVSLKLKAEENVKAAISRLQTFQLPDGSFSYWPGNSNGDDWATTYVGHFLVEAKNKGYFVPETMLGSWKSYQKAQANNWKNTYPNASMHSAYRLYTLALAGSAEMPAMNRLKESGQLDVESAWRLAAAYAIIGQQNIAAQLIAGTYPDKPANAYSYNYGSDLRDRAMRLETLVLLGDRTKAFELVTSIAAELNNNSKWFNTHATAYALLGVSKFLGNEKTGKGLSFTYSAGANTKTISTGLSITRIMVDNADKKQTVKINSKSDGALFVKLVRIGIPVAGNEVAEERNIRMAVLYKNNKGVVVDPSALEQGSDFTAEVSISNTGNSGEIKNVALSQVFPSGWEIQNMRLDNSEGLLNESSYDYRDIRDDRVNTFFTVPATGTRTYKVLLTAAYAGRFYLPSVNCSAMYDNSYYARTKGMWVEVKKKEMLP